MSYRITETHTGSVMPRSVIRHRPIPSDTSSQWQNGGNTWEPQTDEVPITPLPLQQGRTKNPTAPPTKGAFPLATSPAPLILRASSLQAHVTTQARATTAFPTTATSPNKDKQRAASAVVTQKDQGKRTKQMIADAPRPSRSLRRQKTRRNRWLHYLLVLFWCTVGAFSLALALSIFLNIFSWSVNSFGDPITYSQPAHRNEMTLLVDGKQEQVSVLVDNQQHLEMVILPMVGAATSRAYVIPGPVLTTTDTHRYYIDVVSAGVDEVKVVVHSQRIMTGWFTTYQPTTNWMINLHGQLGTGGK